MEVKLDKPNELLTHIAVRDPDLGVIRNFSFTEGGLLYSTYLMDVGDSCVLIGTVPGYCFDAWCGAVLSAAEKAISHWIIFDGVQGRECLPKLQSELPGIQIIGDMGTLYSLEEEHGGIEIRGLRTLRLGNQIFDCLAVTGKGKMRLYVIDKETKTLFTDGIFGSFGTAAELDTEQMDAADHCRFLHRAYLCWQDLGGITDREGMANSAAMVRKWDAARICPALGPTVTGKEIEAVLSLYELQPFEQEQPVRICVSYTEDIYLSEMADALLEGLWESFPDGQLHLERLPLGNVSRSYALEKIQKADALLLGVGIHGGEISAAMLDTLRTLRPDGLVGKKIFFYAGTGGDLQAGETIMAQLIQLGAKPCDNGYLFCSRPEQSDWDQARNYGFGVGCALQRRPNPRQPKLVKCIVCGEIFDASLGVCPVCGVGLEQCVPVSEEELKFRTATNQEYLILGGGTAAVNAALAIRQRDAAGQITLVSTENYLPINRPMLSKDLDRSACAEDIQLHPKAWYEEKQIRVITGVSAEKIVPAEKMVVFSDGAVRHYDKLIYALGAESFIPPCEGWEKQGVFTIRHVEDVARLNHALETAKQCVVIGGGVLGLEAAYEVWRQGIKVTVIETAPQLLGRSVNAATAQGILERLKSMGVSCFTSVQVTEIVGEDAVSGVQVKDGRVFPADVVIVSCGSRANAQLAIEAGCTAERAVVVSARMETSLPDVYACGDCAQLNGVNYQLWGEASEQGRTAGANAAGEGIMYSCKPAGLSMDAFGMSFFSMGDVGQDPRKSYRTVEVKDDVAGRWLMCWFCEGVVSGAAYVNCSEKADWLQQAVLSKMSYREFCEGGLPL